jgi:hypothetical protein
MVFVEISWREEGLPVSVGGGDPLSLRSYSSSIADPAGYRLFLPRRPFEEQPKRPVGPPAQIERFRRVRFGMSEEQVRQAIRKDFPAAGNLTSAVHPSGKTTVPSVSVTDLPPAFTATGVRKWG